MSPNSSENKEREDALTISQLNRQIKKSLDEHFPEKLWVIGEISEFRMHSSGHVYLDLIEKDKKTDSIRARIRATIWSFNYRMLRPYFEGTTGYALEAGIKVLVQVGVEFHPQYGLSLNINDIDPNYTLGDLARKKAEIINRLIDEGVIDMNKSIPFPFVPQRIAVISSETAAGYGDFLETLENNAPGYHFNITLFPSIMQGDKSAASIIRSLENIYNMETRFDLVAIIRGGGAKIDLECFNDYDLALHICQFTLPVITGIGHERDDTITDMVAHLRLKTPTAVAEYLIDRYTEFSQKLDAIQNTIAGVLSNKIILNQQKLTGYTSRLKLITSGIIHQEESNVNSYGYRLRNFTDRLLSRLGSELGFIMNRMDHSTSSYFREKHKATGDLSQDLNNHVNRILERENKRIEQLAKINGILDPVHILERGFSITLTEGRIVKSAGDVRAGGMLETRLSKGTIYSKVTNKPNKNGKKES